VRALLLIPLLPTLAEAAEAVGPTMSEKLHAKIMASVPRALAKPDPDAKKDANSPAEAAAVVVMSPLLVSSSAVVQRVTVALARAEEYRVAEKFTPLSGGTIYTGTSFQLGSWWEPREGWTFFRKNKRPGQHQIADTAARIQELKQLQTIGVEKKAAGKDRP
jgi:hypothetical protein